MFRKKFQTGPNTKIGFRVGSNSPRSVKLVRVFLIKKA